MPTVYAQVNQNILSWARNRAQLSTTLLAEKLNVKAELLRQWEAGDKLPTFKQAQNFANKTHIPFGYLYLRELPQDELPIPDLRTIGGDQPERPSAELIEMVKIVSLRQLWFREYAIANDIQENVNIGRFTADSPVHLVVDDLREKLEVGRHPVRGKWEEYFNLLAKKAENVGILVMRNSNLGHHTRPLSVEEFRGFAIFDRLAPAIFINQADSPSARLFTLIHEVAHIWIGESGISDGKPASRRREEIQCNAVAAEFLVPGDEFTNLWQEEDDWKRNIEYLNDHFRVSTWVLARRALSLDKISMDQYESFVAEIGEQHSKREKKKGGPTYYMTKKSQISERFSRALVSETLSGRVLLRDAGRLLGIKPENIMPFAKELNI